MTLSTENRDHILRDIETLPPHKVVELIHFIEFLKATPPGNRSAVNEFYLQVQEASLNKIWGDEEDLYEL